VMRRLILLALPALLLSVVCLARAAGPPQDQTGPPASASREVRLVGGDWGLPTPFTFYPRGPGYIHLSLVFDTLVWKDQNGVIPWLADRWERSPDGLQWTFHLRPGVKWQDGRPLTVADVCFSLDYLQRQTFEWLPLEKILRVEPRDDATLVVHLQAPYAPFLTQIAGSLPIIPRHIWQDVADPRATAGLDRVMGSGPYRLVHYDKAQGAYEYQANDQFFRGKPAIGRVLFVPAADPVAALQRGIVDEAGIPASLLPQFNGRNDFAILRGPSFWVLTLRFNTNALPFSQRPVRQALAYAIDRKALIEQAVPGGIEGATPGNPGFLPPDSEWFDPAQRELYPFQLEQARDLLRTAGIEDRNGDGLLEDAQGKKMEFTLITTSQFLREAEALQLMLRTIGFSVQPKAMDIKSLDAQVRAGSFELALTGHGGLGADPSAVMGFGAMDGRMQQFGAPTDPAFRDLAERLLTSTDHARRLELARDMQRIYAEELPTLPLYYPTRLSAYRPKVQDGWFYTAHGGVGIGIPLPYNKLLFILGGSP